MTGLTVHDGLLELPGKPTIRRSDYGAGAGEGQKIVVGDKITIQLDIQAMLES